MLVNLENGHTSKDTIIHKFKDRGLFILFICGNFELGKAFNVNPYTKVVT